ncbi:helix-turn-helix transcriptional regulator [Shewanella psychropiezotolerans]|uniref:Helix-turn-helix transcriptional regulator n=1 Tax=Shewanella psychropiezotolerans TaxID=2593655 RepID=A0ABX5WYM0_9GAMM|nr:MULTISPECIES: helix-turn-helix domain-containing protein [Shewanella]MPY23932.1 helix-turn-helix transcriptional regulator [Shewanella sp. YLB-07]QDO84200.1 helix-turn-helix transcriptional regulator [Shewanella psychropiezotolerans]
MRHVTAPEGYCNVDKYLSLISTKWTAHIVYLLGKCELMRFGQIQKELALVSSKVLSSRLKLLEAEQFIWREQQATIPVTVNYGLTAKGKELAEIVSLIVDKSDAWDANITSK